MFDDIIEACSIGHILIFSGLLFIFVNIDIYLREHWSNVSPTVYIPIVCLCSSNSPI